VSLRTAALAAFCAATAAAGQTPVPQRPTFKVQVDYVEVDALVTDSAGGSVSDLKKEDFQVLEDGRPQTITAFSFVHIPVEQLQRPLGAAAPIEPDVKDNERPFDGRLYVMIIDDAHIGFQRTPRVKSVAKEFIEKHLGSNDLMAVLHTTGGPRNGQELTSNKRLLLAAVDHTFGDKADSAAITKARGGNFNAPNASAATNDPERAAKDGRMLNTVVQVAAWFNGIHGRRKSILLVSEGIDYDITDPFNNPNASTINDATRNALVDAARANVSVYSIDPRGLTVGNEDAIEFGAASEVGRHGADPGPDQSALTRELQLSQDSLRALSDNTGGFAIVNQNGFANGFDRIVQDNSSYYVLAYYPPTTDTKPGKFHKIEVHVGRPGVTVRARPGYATPNAKPAAKPAAATKATSVEIQDALDSPLPLTGLTLHVFAAPFKGTAASASVLVLTELSGRDLKLAPKSSIELSYRAVDAEGKIRGGDTQLVTLPENVQPGVRARMEQVGLRITDRIDLAPGRYQVHVAARDTSGGSLGSVTYDLDVPDFNKGPLTISGLALTSTAGSLMPTMHPDALMKDAMQASPAALRRFPANDELTVFAEVYDNAASSPHKVDITTTLAADDGRVVFKADDERSSTDIQGKRGGYGYSAKIPLKGIAPGTYVLKVEARSRLGEGASARREVQFTIQ
jgi:VWFA-related protein